jgi:hypothetical protein
VNDVQLDFLVETLELLLDNNKTQRRNTSHEVLSSYFDGKIEAYEVAIRTVKNSKEIFRNDYTKER